MPGMGPIAIFDKSALESLNPDEAVWLDCFYKTNITPLFYVETLADLYKGMRKGRSPEQVVGSIAYKTPDFGIELNIHHLSLCINDLLGYPVRMNGYPVVAGFRSVMTGDQMGLVLERAREIEAFERWQKGEFLDLERQIAKQWRQGLSSLDPHLIIKDLGVREQQIKLDKREVKSLVDRAVRGERKRFGALKAALETQGVPENLRDRIIRRWKSEGGPPLITFAPYAAHVFSVDMFISIGLATGVISPGRPSNIIDLAYLYYLPFCMVFISGDKLHRKTAPLFLRKDQDFIWSPELKADLMKLDAHFSAFPESVKAEGLFAFASWPPEDMGFLTTRLWDRHLPAWREILANEKKRAPSSNEEHERLMAKLNEMDAAQPTERQVTIEEARFVKSERYVPISKGKWRLLPPGVEASREN